jgi:hypothetical protein
MPWLVFIGHSTSRNYLFALATPSGEFLLVTTGTINILIFRYEALGAYGRFTESTFKTSVVPLLSLIFHFLHPRSENLGTPITPSGESIVIAVGAEDPIVLAPKWLVHQRDFAFIAKEAVLVPMLVFIG